MTNMIRDRYHFYSVDEITTPRSGEAIRDAFWLVDHHGRVGFYTLGVNFAPQCNSDRAVADKILSSGTIPWATGIVQIPLAFLPDPPDRIKQARRRFDAEY